MSMSGNANIVSELCRKCPRGWRTEDGGYYPKTISQRRQPVDWKTLVEFVRSKCL